MDILNDFGKIETKSYKPLMIPNVNLKVEDENPLENLEKYRRIVRKLNYLATTRPYIAFSMSVVSQFMSFP